jgi:hypothetical protein
MTQFWEEQAYFFTITMTPPTQHSAAIIFLWKQNSSASTPTLQPWSLSSSLFMFLKQKVDLKGCQFVLVEEMQAK